MLFGGVSISVLFARLAGAIHSIERWYERQRQRARGLGQSSPRTLAQLTESVHIYHRLLGFTTPKESKPLCAKMQYCLLCLRGAHVCASSRPLRALGQHSTTQNVLRLSRYGPCRTPPKSLVRREWWCLPLQTALDTDCMHFADSQRWSCTGGVQVRSCTGLSRVVSCCRVVLQTRSTWKSLHPPLPTLRSTTSWRCMTGRRNPLARR